MKINKSAIFFSTLLFFIVSFIALATANAQQTVNPQFWVTWQAKSLAPADFKGKIFPATGVPIDVTFELLNNGKIANLSNNEVRWYLDDRFKQSGFNLKKLSFVATGYSGSEHSIRIEVLNYSGQSQLTTIKIPVVGPQLIIKAPYQTNEIKASEINLEAIPYFFNVKSMASLNIDWLVNNQPAGVGVTDNKFVFKIPTGTQSFSDYTIRANAKNPTNELEFASKSLNFKLSNK